MSKEKIVVSIICNTYNHENYIGKALESLICQKTNFNFEILVHDDCSTDSTGEIIKKYEREYPDIIKPIYADENRMSKGINVSYFYQYPRAKGDYVAYCEGDDFWVDENKLQKQVDFLEQNKEFIGCVHKYIVVNKNGEKTDIKTFGFYENEGIYSFDDFFMEELPSQVASLVCRNIFNKKGKAYPREFVDVKIQGDIKLYLYLLTYGDIYRMGETMSAYRFVCEADGTSWSSRSKKNATGYKTWKALCLLEETYNKLYNRNICLNKRKIAAAVKTVIDLRKFHDHINFINAIKVIIKQKGTCKALLKRIIRRKKNERH